METLPNGYTLNIPAGCFPLSTDSMALAWFAGIRGEKKLLDLGSGCGTLGLLVCSENAKCCVTGAELNPDAHAAALDNIQRNRLEDRLQSICMDLCQVPEVFAPGQFDAVLSNPPYFSGGPAAALKDARREDRCSLEDLMRSAAWALKFGGDFFLVHRPERLGELIALASQHHLEAKRLGLLRHQEGRPVSLILVQLRKGAKPGLNWEDIILKDTAGNPTDTYKRIYHQI